MGDIITSNTYSLSGCKANNLAKLNWLNYLKDNLYFSITTRRGLAWGEYCYVGVENTLGSDTNGNMIGVVNISEENDKGFEFECVHCNKKWILVKSKSVNGALNISDLTIKNPAVYFGPSGSRTSVKIRSYTPSDSYKFLKSYLKPQGVFGRVFDNLTLIVSTNDEIKVVGIDDSDLENINSGFLNLEGIVYDLTSDSNDMVIEGLKYVSMVDFGNHKALVFEFPVNGGRKTLYISSESTSKYEYLIIPDTNIESLAYSFSNDELPPPISEIFINDNFITDAMFFSAFDKNLMSYRNKISYDENQSNSKVFFCRKKEEDSKIADPENDSVKMGYNTTTDFKKALELNYDNLMVVFKIPKLSCEKIVSSVGDVTDLSSGKVYLCSGSFVGHANKVIVCNGSPLTEASYHEPSEVMFLYNKDIGVDPYVSTPTNLNYNAGSWEVATENERLDYYRQLSVVNINNGKYDLLYLANLPKFKIAGDFVEVSIIL